MTAIVLNRAESTIRDTVVCSSCWATVDANSQFCTQCGRTLQPSEETSECGSCGTPLESGIRFCLECGAAVQIDAGANRSAESKKTYPIHSSTHGWLHKNCQRPNRFSVSNSAFQNVSGNEYRTFMRSDCMLFVPDFLGGWTELYHSGKLGVYTASNTKQIIRRECENGWIDSPCHRV